jgi:hypothetical protein
VELVDLGEVLDMEILEVLARVTKGGQDLLSEVSARVVRADGCHIA